MFSLQTKQKPLTIFLKDKIITRHFVKRNVTTGALRYQPANLLSSVLQELKKTERIDFIRIWHKERSSFVHAKGRNSYIRWSNVGPGVNPRPFSLCCFLTVSKLSLFQAKKIFSRANSKECWHVKDNCQPLLNQCAKITFPQCKSQFTEE